jgi:hypothetical protein
LTVFGETGQECKKYRALWKTCEKIQVLEVLKAMHKQTSSFALAVMAGMAFLAVAGEIYSSRAALAGLASERSRMSSESARMPSAERGSPLTSELIGWREFAR